MASIMAWACACHKPRALSLTWRFAAEGVGA
jgi:hypothetical protein